MRRLSTLTFGRRAAAALEDGAKLAAALDSPLIVDILETLDAHESALFFILGPVQFFKTAVGQLHLARNHYVRPRRVAWYAPTEAFGKDFADTKLNPLLDAILEFSPPGSRHASSSAPPETGLLVLDDKNKLSRLRRTYATGGHLILSAQTENDRTGKSFPDIYCDESHLYEPGALQQIQNRRADYADEFKELHMSTGLNLAQGAKGSEAAALWATTDQRLWHGRCPACQKLFEPRYTHREKADDPESPIIGGFVYKRTFLENGMPDEAALAATLVYQCPRCAKWDSKEKVWRGYHLPDSDRSRVALSGTVQRPRGLYISQNAHPSARRFGWNFNAIAGRAWLPIVIRFEKAQLARQRGDLDPLGLVIREEFGGLWDPESHLRTQKPKPAGDYPMGQDWPEEMLDAHGRPVRCITCDPQTDCYHMVMRMWARHGASRLRHTETLTSISRLRDLQLEHNVISDRVYLDGRHDPEHVKQIAARYGWRVFLGEKDKDWLHHSDHTRRIYSEPRYEDAFKGTIHAGTSGKVPVVLFSKQSATTRLHLLRTMVSADGQPLWTTANNAPARYYTELEAHYRVRKVTEDGTVYYVWAGRHDDHAADCEVMQVVFASMAGLIGSESLETAAA